MIRFSYDKLSTETQDALRFLDLVTKYNPVSKEALLTEINNEKDMCKRTITRGCCEEHVTSATTYLEELIRVEKFILEKTHINSDN